MKHNYLLSLLFLFLYLQATAQEDISIYHGKRGESTIFLGNKDAHTSSWKDSTVFIKSKGEKVEIVILNPNPFFYSYEIKMEEFEIADNFPDITELLAAINALPDLQQKAADGSKVFRPAPPVPATALQRYQKVISDLSAEIKDVKSKILMSDQPESKEEALTGALAVNGYRMAVQYIKLRPVGKGHFNSPTLEADLKEYLDAALQDPALTQNVAAAETDRVTEVYAESFTLLDQKLVETINAIKKASNADPVIRFELPFTDKNLKVRLIVKKKDPNTNVERMEFDKLICVMIPEFDRNVVELVPVVNLSYASGVPEFSVKDGVIVKGQADGFKFRVGAMLLYNFLHWGKFKEGSWGAGIGYNAPQKDVWNSFYLGSMISYRSQFRFGAGVGFSSYPWQLKENYAEGNALPSNIKNVEDIVEYRRKLSFFISFAISGITILKK